jgi:hypothetical protein
MLALADGRRGKNGAGFEEFGALER